jgi:hypothetical protein
MRTYNDEDDQAEDDEPSAAAEYFAELGAGLHDALYPADSGGIEPRQVAGRRERRGASAEFVPVSANRKLSPVRVTGRVGNFYRLKPEAPFCCSTFASIETTCPESCEFKDNGCMADAGFTRIRSRKLNSAARGLTELQVIAEEAREIDLAFGGGPIPQDGALGGRDLRIHVGGDVQTEAAARLLADAAAGWLARGGGSVWTFTHSWRVVPRAAWGCISVLASVESPADLALALERGYAPAIVVGSLPDSGRRMAVPGSTVPVIPCPGETRQATCVGCRLCLDRPLAAMGTGIAFGVHGRDAKRAETALVQLGRARDGVYHCGVCGELGHNAKRHAK